MTPFEAMYGRKDTLYNHTPSTENNCEISNPISEDDFSNITATTSEINNI